MPHIKFSRPEIIILTSTQAQAESIRKKILDLETSQNNRLGTSPSALIHSIDADQSARGSQPSERLDDELEASLRELIKLDNEVIGHLKSEDGGNDISTQMGILSALRSSDDTPTSASRATSVGKSRDRQGKRKVTDSLDDRESTAADSPGPSPKVVISQKDKLIAKSTSSRAGSVPVREGSVKAEDDDNGKGKKGRSSISRSLSNSAMNKSVL